MIRIVSIVTFTLFCFLGNAQNPSLFAKSDDGKLYLDHKVAPKESLYALGRLYNVSAKYLAAYNKIDMSKGLQIDQKLKIPLTDTNFIQTGNTGAPVYYKVGDKEGLSTVSKKNNGVKLAELRSWNQLSTDVINKDAKLVVGFLKGSGFKSITIAPMANPTELPPPPAQKNVIDEKPVEVAKEKVPEQIPTSKKEEPAPVVPKEELKPKTTIQPVTSTNTPANEGYFQTDFSKQIRLTPVSVNETVTSGIFKTTSGWQDYKYYLLIDKIMPGTIIKVTNPVNNKTVYAKVLGEMSGIRQNTGLNIRISNAAAATLEVKEDDKFILKISY
jgi:hypothetical protein